MMFAVLEPVFAVHEPRFAGHESVFVAHEQDFSFGKNTKKLRLKKINLQKNKKRIVNRKE